MFNLENAVAQTMSLQDKANQVMAGGDWTKNGIDWVSCAVVELGESFPWSAYKHWKKMEHNFFQAFVEIVDSYHFMLSLAIERGITAQALSEHAKKALMLVELQASKFNESTDLDEQKRMAKTGLKQLMAHCLQAEFDNEILAKTVAAHLIAASQMGFNEEDFIRAYVPKNCLNLFRQHNGDRAGQYPRMWHFEGQEIEDNQVVETLVKRNPDLAYDSVALASELQSILDGIRAQSH